MILHFGHYTNVTILLLRVLVALIFIDSGRRDLKNPTERAGSIGLSKSFAVLLGIAEIAGGLGLVLGVLTQYAAIGLIVIMLGAIQKKMFVWHSGFWGEKGIGWHYELLLVLILLMILTTNGGGIVLMK